MATTRDPILSEIEPLFRKALLELGIAIPSRREAEWIVIRHFMHGIAGRELDPTHALSEIDSIRIQSDSMGDDELFVGDHIGLQELVGLLSSADEPVRRRWYETPAMMRKRATSEFDRAAVRLARIWLQRDAEAHFQERATERTESFQ
ncbi:MAG TPA: hypothetical protein VM509_07550 [Planctomycetota bacterium]|nr:hypothetical protein [Planctomycetota bacterium]